MTCLTPTSFGLFLSPLHPPGQDVSMLLADDLALAEHADRLGFEEFWIGEHHSGGWGTVGSPELFLAAAAQRTTRITLATGVVSLPYHHPFMTAERAVLLDHLTRGRFVLGVGAGSLTADMAMFGIDPRVTRRRLEESAEVVGRLLRGETVTCRTDWFELHDAALQIGATRPEGPPMVVASAVTPSGMRLAGRLGAQPLSHAAPPWGVIRPGSPVGIERLPAQWEAYAEAAQAAGHVPDRRDWRLLLPVHVSRDAETARAELVDGWTRLRRQYWTDTLAMPMSRHPDAALRSLDATIAAGGIVLGSPDDCVEQIQRLAAACGGFGTLLIACLDWASPDDQLAGLERFARFVAPRLRGLAERPLAAQARGARVSRELAGVTAQAQSSAVPAPAPLAAAAVVQC
ncbi:MAG: LLM class flavin-dependent oxidoreductase [Blastococcus sp.]